MTDYREFAELFKVVAHPARLQMLKRLLSDVLCVSDMEDLLGVSQPNISQHLSLLRRYGLVDYYVDGKLRCYFLKDPRVPDIVALLDKTYKGALPSPVCCPASNGKSKGAVAPSDRMRTPRR